MADLDAAIAYLREAVQGTPVGHPHRAERLSNLGGALRQWFWHTDAEADLDAAVTHFREAVHTTPVGYPGRAMLLSNLGSALQERSRRIGAEADLDAAIAYLREAVQITPVGYPEYATHLSNLGIALGARSNTPERRWIGMRHLRCTRKQPTWIAQRRRYASVRATLAHHWWREQIRSVRLAC